MAWIDVVRETLKGVEQIADGLEGTRNAVFGLWLAIDGAPSNVRDLYRGFGEEKLQSEAAALAPDEIFRNPPGGVRTRAEKEALLLWLAVRLRALEIVLYSIADGSPVKRSSDCEAHFGAEAAYILMRDPLNRVAKTGDLFRRRGLRHARVIPTNIGDFSVKLLLTQINQTQHDRPTKKAMFAGGGSPEANVDASWPIIAALRSDLLTPINSINSIARLLMQDLGQPRGKSNYGELVSGIIDQSTQLRTLLRDIVNVGELFGSSRLKEDRVQPTALLETVLADLNYTTRHAQLSFSTKKTSTETVETNERALRGVMLQAVTGIVEMTPNGGNVGIETALENDMIVMRVFTHSIDKEFSAIGAASKTLILCEHVVRHFGGEFDFTSWTSDGVSARFSWPVFRRKRVRLGR